MKKIYFKTAVCTCVLLALICPISIHASDATTPSLTMKPIDIKIDSVSPYINDVIIYIYRHYKGRLQYRRWNETRQVWVDPYWITLN